MSHLSLDGSVLKAWGDIPRYVGDVRALAMEDAPILDSKKYDFFGFVDRRLKFAGRAVSDRLIMFRVHHAIARVVHRGSCCFSIGPT